MGKKITIKVNSITVNPEDIFEGKVVKSGNGGVVPFFKRFIGKKVYIVIKEVKR